MHESLQGDSGDFEPQSIFRRIFFASWFYLAMAAGLGGLIGSLIIEPYFAEPVAQAENPAGEDQDQEQLPAQRLDQIERPGAEQVERQADQQEDEFDGFRIVAFFLLFPTVTGFIGLFLGAGEGLMCRNLGRALLSGAVGLGIGFVGGVVAFLVGLVFFCISQTAAVQITGDGESDAGIGLLMLMMARAAGWSIASIPAGMGQGIATRQMKVFMNGIVGGMIGGFIGGLLFAPIYLVAQGEDALSRGVGFTVIGVMVGLFVGLVEGWTKTAWLLMKQGPLAGKQFVLFRDTAVLGSSPKADIYLFKDDAIEPRHAMIHNRGGRFEIEDLRSADGTYVNGTQIQKQILKHGDQISLGKTVFAFAVKDA